MILFSIPVHEEPQVILDQIANFRRFAPSCGIVIHPSRQFLHANPDLPALLEAQEGVFVNRDALYTAQHLVLKCHVSNFFYAKKIGLDFTHFCHHASNDLFVRSGVEEFISKHDFGFQIREAFKESLNFTFWRENFRDDPNFPKMITRFMKPIRYLVSQAEGSFFPACAYQEFAKDYREHAWKEFGKLFPYSHGSSMRFLKFFDKLHKTPQRRKYVGRFFYPKEEFYPPNYFIYYCEKPASPYCLMNWDRLLKVEQSDVDMIRSGIHPIPGYDQLFSVKRVDRRMNDPLRAYIRELR